MKKFVMKTEVASRKTEVATSLAPCSSNFFIKNGGQRPPFFMNQQQIFGEIKKKWWPKAAIFLKIVKNSGENFLLNF